MTARDPGCLLPSGSGEKGADEVQRVSPAMILACSLRPWPCSLISRSARSETEPDEGRGPWTWSWRWDWHFSVPNLSAVSDVISRSAEAQASCDRAGLGWARGVWRGFGRGLRYWYWHRALCGIHAGWQGSREELSHSLAFSSHWVSEARPALA